MWGGEEAFIWNIHGTYIQAVERMFKVSHTVWQLNLNKCNLSEFLTEEQFWWF